MIAWDGRESAHYGLQDAPGTATCQHCGDSFSAADEDTEPRYSGLCEACAEFFRDSDERELRLREDDDASATRRYYDGG